MTGILRGNMGFKCAMNGERGTLYDVQQRLR